MHHQRTCNGRASFCRAVLVPVHESACGTLRRPQVPTDRTGVPSSGLKSGGRSRGEADLGNASVDARPVVGRSTGYFEGVFRVNPRRKHPSGPPRSQTTHNDLDLSPRSFSIQSIIVNHRYDPNRNNRAGEMNGAPPFRDHKAGVVSVPMGSRSTLRSANQGRWRMGGARSATLPPADYLTPEQLAPPTIWSSSTTSTGLPGLAPDLLSGEDVSLLQRSPDYAPPSNSYAGTCRRARSPC